MRKHPQIDSPFLLGVEDLPRKPDHSVAWEEIFSRQYPLRVEVGVGNSPFLIEVARHEPTFNYLGFEYSGKRVLKFLKKVDASGLENIRMMRVNAVSALPQAIEDGQLDHIFINFPDPWPKRRHAKKRFVQGGVIQVLTRLLRAGGGISLRTDVAYYAEQMIEVLEGCQCLVNTTGPRNFAAEPRYTFPTTYEVKFRTEGRRIHYLEYNKVDTDQLDAAG